MHPHGMERLSLGRCAMCRQISVKSDRRSESGSRSNRPHRRLWLTACAPRPLASTARSCPNVPPPCGENAKRKWRRTRLVRRPKGLLAQGLEQEQEAKTQRERGLWL